MKPHGVPPSFNDLARARRYLSSSDSLIAANPPGLYEAVDQALEMCISKGGVGKEDSRQYRFAEINRRRNKVARVSVFDIRII
jgi:hypothetical protein